MLTITIVAIDSAQPPRTDAELERVKAKLADMTDAQKQNHRVGFAPSVELLKRKVRELSHGFGPNNRPDRIQIVGHGTGGMLSLARHFNNMYKESDEGQYFVLDSSPYVYGTLAPVIQPETEVLILGCNVGDGEQGPESTPGRGPTLLFDLAQTWGCKVGAPVRFISADDFDDEGIFKTESRKQLRFVEGFTFTDPVSTPVLMTHSENLSTPPVARLTALRSAPILGLRSRFLQNAALVTPAATTLIATYRRKVVLGPVLALPELIFDAKWGPLSVPATAELIGNGRVLRYTTDTEVHHFAADHAAELASAFGLTASLLAPAFDLPLPP